MSQWLELAAEAEARAQYEDSRGGYSGVCRNKAAIYRRAHEANELEASTGRWHCVCCLKPVLACASRPK